MKKPQKNLIIMAAGGTGGHLFPAKVLAAELKNRHYQVAFISDKRAIPFRQPEDKEDWYFIDSAGVVGIGIFKKINNLWKVFKGLRQAKKLLRLLQPAVVVGFGGYASFPTMRAAQSLGIPTVLHEQNAVFGRANRHLLAGANIICLGLPQITNLPADYMSKMHVSGNPVRAEIIQAARHPYIKPQPAQAFHLLILGGSQGAQSFSRFIPPAIALLPLRLRQSLIITQQCRSEDLESVQNFYETLGLKANLGKFFQDVPAQLATCQLLISRAGASTIAELCLVGRPALLIPLPSAADNHQEANAQILVDSRAGWMMTESMIKASPEALAKKLQELMENPDELSSRAERARTLANDQAVHYLANAVLSLISNQPHEE